MSFTNGQYTPGKLSHNKRAMTYFDKHIGIVTYWKPFKFGKHMYIMTFDYTLYEVS